MSRRPQNAQLADLAMVDKLRADADAIRAHCLKQPSASMQEIATDLYAASDRIELAAFGIDVDAIALLFLERDLTPPLPALGRGLGETLERALERRGGK